MRSEIPVLITSCWRDIDKHDAIRETWGKSFAYPIFFVGKGRGIPPARHMVALDTIITHTPDDYQHVPWKTQYQARWALTLGASHVFICDVDTYVDPVRLLANIPSEDYVGHRCDEGHASGGNGYWLSQAACRRVAQANPREGYADLWIGDVLAACNIRCYHDPRYGDGTITRHLSVNGRYDPELMYEEHIKRYPR